MTEQENGELGYLTQDALLGTPAFTSTVKRGYVEDEVDEWAKKAVVASEELVNQYNLVVYRCLQAEQAVVDLSEQNETLQTRIAELEANPTVATPDNSYYEALATQEPVVEETIEADAVESALDDPYAYEATPVVEPVTETIVAAENLATLPVSEKAQRILDAAAEEATEHVRRAFKKVASIEAEAEAEANELVANANSNAENIVTVATDEAETIVADAHAATAEALEQLETAKAHATELFKRITAFHEYELERAHEIYAQVAPEPEKVEKIVSYDETLNEENVDEAEEFDTEENVTEETVELENEIFGDAETENELYELDGAENVADTDEETVEETVYNTEISENVTDETALNGDDDYDYNHTGAISLEYGTAETGTEEYNVPETDGEEETNEELTDADGDTPKFLLEEDTVTETEDTDENPDAPYAPQNS